MLKKSLIGLTLLAGAVAPVTAHAATITIEMHNHYFQATAVVAQAGDTIVLHNLGGRKVVQTYSDNQLPPTTVDSNQSISFVFNGTATGLNADDVDPQTPALSTVNNGNCTGMCGRVTPTGPENYPGQPVFTSPTNGGSSGNTVLFSGTAANASKVRVKVGSLIRSALVDGTGSWSYTQTHANGTYTAIATAVHPEGFESTTASVTFTVSGGDTQPPMLLAGNPAKIAGQPSQVKFGTIFVGHGPIYVTGVVIDDVSAKKVTATVKDALIPDTEVELLLQCSNPNSIPAGESVPCDSATNPFKIQYRANHLVARPGHYVLTTTATDAAGASVTTVQDVIILSPL